MPNKKKIVYVLVILIILSILISILFFLGIFKTRERAPTGMVLCGGTSCNLGVSLVICEDCTCIQNWTCGEWSVCQPSNTQIRTCTDSNRCVNQSQKPDETQSCIYTAATSEGNEGGGINPEQCIILQEKTNGILTNLDTISVVSVTGETKNKTISIENICRNTFLNIKVDNDGINKNLFFSQKEFKLTPGEKKEILIQFSNIFETEKNNYGNILIKSNDMVLKSIPVTVFLEEEKISEELSSLEYSSEEIPSLEKPTEQTAYFEKQSVLLFWLYILMLLCLISGAIIHIVYLIKNKK